MSILRDQYEDLSGDYDVEPTPEEISSEHRELGNDAFRRLNYTESLRHYTEAIKLCPSNAINYSNRAAVHMALNDYRVALEDCLTSLSFDSTYLKATFRAIKCQIRLGLLEDAKRNAYSISERTRKDKQFATLIVQLADIESAVRRADSLLLEDRIDDARDVIDTLSESMESSSALGILKARLLLGEGKNTAAQKILTALYHRPENDQNMELLTWRGVAMYRNGRDDLARRHFTEVLRVDPDNNTAMRYHKLMRKLEQSKEAANDIFKRGRLDESIELYTNCLSIDPGNSIYRATILGNRAAAYMQQRKFTPASHDCSLSLTLNPGNARVITRRARCWMSLGQLNDAVRDFEAAIEAGAQDLEEELEVAQGLLRRAKQASLYTELGVPVTSTIDEIKRAYKKLALRYHPDRNRGCSDAAMAATEKKFKIVTEAYNILSDPKKKRMYDMGHDIEDIIG